MAIRQWNDPALGAGFENLAAAFAPPSGSDMSGYAMAGAKKAEADRLAWLFQNSSDPTASARSALTGVQGYGQTPAGFAATDATDRYGIDSTARSNAEVAGINNAGALDRQNAEPVVVGKDQTVFLPGQTQAATGLPGLFTGVVGASPGETVAVPGQAEPMRGAPTMDTFKAAIMSGLPEPIQQAVASGMTSIEQIIMGDGAVKNATALGAVGATPAPTGTPETQNYITEDGKQRGSAVYDRTKGWVDAQTGEVLPPGTTTFSTAVGGDKDATGTAKVTEYDAKNNKVGSLMAPGIAALNQAYSGDKSISAGALAVKGMFGDSPAITDMAQRAGIINPDDQAIMGAINSVMTDLYILTGAARTEGEDARGYAELVPLASDTPERRQFKRDMLNQKALSVIRQSKDPQLKAELEAAVQGLFASPVLNPAAGGDMPTVNTPEEAAALPSGTKFKDPQGNIRVVP